MIIKKVYYIVGIIGGLLGIVASLSTYVGLPFPSLLLFGKHTVTRVHSDPKFSIEAIKTYRNILISSGDSFSYNFDVPLSARGVTTLSDGEKVWVVLADELGNFYLQNPPVTIRSGQWAAMNILPLNGIRRIIFFRVGGDGDQFFRRKVEHDEWGKFSSIPDGALELAFVEL